MNNALSIFHGKFGRAGLYALDQPIKTHVHREGHLNFLVDGLGAHTKVGKQTLFMGPESACAINPWQPHSFDPEKQSKESIFLILYIDPYWALQKCETDIFLVQFGSTNIQVTPQIKSSISTITKLMLSRNVHDRQLLETQLQELTKICSRQSFSPENLAEHFARSKHLHLDWRIKKSMEIMTKSHGTHTHFNDVARETGLSRPHFYSLFRKNTGITPALFAGMLKAEKSIEYLTKTDLKISDISDRLGFESQSGFSKFFSSHVGIAPSKYKKVAQILDDR